MGLIRKRVAMVGSWSLLQFKQVRERNNPLHPERLDHAVKSVRKLTLTKAILFFAFTMTLDDLAILRFPAYMIAAGGALGIVSFGSLIAGARLTRQYDHLDELNFHSRLGELERVGLLSLIGALILLVAWFILFSAGVPPWSG